MLVSQEYSQILQMIMRRMKVYDSVVSTGTSGGTSSVSPTDEGSVPNPNDPGSMTNDFDGYDYHLIYDDEEELTGFSSHDGKIMYTLEYDSFDELTHLTVETPTITFIIALIFQNYDMRIPDPETDEKGLLTDVVILSLDGQAITEGIALEPETITVSEGETIQFKCKLIRIDGTFADVTTSTLWSTNNPEKYSISDGRILDPKEGSGKVLAKYQYSIVEGTFIVMKENLVVKPSYLSINANESAVYKAFAVTENGVERDVTDECIWVSSLYSVTLGVVSNTLDSGVATITATRKNKSATAQLEVKADSIEITPSPQTVNVGASATFKAILKSTGEDVTSRATWQTSAYTMVQPGIVAQTLTIGQALITASVDGHIGSGELNVVRPEPLECDHDARGLGMFTANDYQFEHDGNVAINYDMYSFPDAVDVYTVDAVGNTGTIIATTNGRVSDKGTVSFRVTSGQIIRVIVWSDSDSTAWEYHIGCPN